MKQSISLAIAAVCCAAGTAAAELPKDLELGARAGIQHTTLEFSDDAPDGSGGFVDASIGVRMSPGISLSMFSAYSSIHDTFGDPFAYQKTYDARVRLLDVGLRLSFHTHGVVAGIGVGVEHLAQRIDTMHYSENCSLIQLHAGYTFPRIRQIGGGAIQLLAFIGKADTKYDGDIVISGRLAIGLEY